MAIIFSSTATGGDADRDANVHGEVRGRRLRRVFAGFILSSFFGVLAVPTGCGGPKYPACENDGECNEGGRKGVCVNRTCVQCRADDACPKGEACRAGACVVDENFCDESRACRGGKTCGKDHACHEAPSPLGGGTQCDDQHACSKGERCENGHCVAPIVGGPGCQDFPAPQFDFQSPDLSTEARRTLQRLAGCLTTGSLKGASVLLTGHCDNRGEEEFNMGLGAERAEAVKTFVIGLGVAPNHVSTSSRGELDANGHDEPSWAHDRRVDVEVRQ